MSHAGSSVCLLLDRSLQSGAWLCRACMLQLHSGAGLASQCPSTSTLLAAGVGTARTPSLDAAFLEPGQGHSGKVWSMVAEARLRSCLKVGSTAWMFPVVSDTCPSHCHWDAPVGAHNITSLSKAPTARHFFQGHLLPCLSVQLSTWCCSCAKHTSIQHSS